MSPGNNYLIAVGTAAVLAASTLFLYNKLKGGTSTGARNGKRTETDEQEGSLPTGLNDLQLEEVSGAQDAEIPPQVKSRFEACAAAIRDQTNLTQPQMLKLYALYKQATSGPCSMPAPNALNVVATAKYKAWKNLGEEMDKMTAMQEYIDLVMLIEFTKEANDQADIIYSDDDGDEDNIMDVGGMGVKPSTLNYGDESEEKVDPGMDSTESELHKFARDNYPQQLENLFNNSSLNPNCLDVAGQTALHLAADRGTVDCISVLLRNGADPNASDADGISVLQTAVIAGHYDVCKALLDAGADPDQADCDGDTARSCARDDPVLSGLFSTSESTGNLSDLSNIPVELDDDGDI